MKDVKFIYYIFLPFPPNKYTELFLFRAFAAQKCVVCVHKHYTPEDWAAFYAESPEVFPYLAVSAGSSDVSHCFFLITILKHITYQSTNHRLMLKSSMPLSLLAQQLPLYVLMLPMVTQKLLLRQYSAHVNIIQQ